MALHCSAQTTATTSKVYFDRFTPKNNHRAGGATVNVEEGGGGEFQDIVEEGEGVQDVLEEGGEVPEVEWVFLIS